MIIRITELHGESAQFRSLFGLYREDGRMFLEFVRMDERFFRLFFDSTNEELGFMNEQVLLERQADGPLRLAKYNHLYEVSISNGENEIDFTNSYLELEEIRIEIKGRQLRFKVYFNEFNRQVTDCIMEQFERED